MCVCETTMEMAQLNIRCPQLEELLSTVIQLD